MYKTFYKYASSSPGRAIVETHYITMALDQWCWYWVVLEASFLALILGVAFFIAGKYWLTSLFCFGVLGAVAILQLIRTQCVSYALQEVEQIVAESKRKSEIAEVFRAL